MLMDCPLHFMFSSAVIQRHCGVDSFQAAEKAIQAQQQPQQQQQQVDWRDLEAPLYCIRGVAGPDILHERTVLPQVRSVR